jgi:hypothetical protein
MNDKRKIGGIVLIQKERKKEKRCKGAGGKSEPILENERREDKK